MFRSTTRRQNDSARQYLDFAALSPALDAAAELTAVALGFPISMINIVDRDSQYTLAQHGFASSAGSVVPRAHTICALTVDADHIVVVADAGAPGTSPLPENNAVREAIHSAGFTAYAGIPIMGREGIVIGTLCVFDTVPHPVTETQEHLLTLLAGTVQDHLDAHRGRTRSPLTPASAAEFATALSSGQIYPWYQPIVDLDSGRIVAVEALARWNHPTRGLLTPEAFLDRIEASDLIIDLDLAVLTHGLRDLLTWLPTENPLRLHANLSGAHFTYPGCVERLITTVRRAGCSPESVVFEITESVSFAVNPANIGFVADLRHAGFGVALDDLGAGWSGFGHLLEFRLSGFKVDKAVTDRIGTRAGNSMMNALHSLAENLQLDLTVEGVETDDQARAVTALGSTRGQGYWWFKPVPANRISQILGTDRSHGGTPDTHHPDR